MSQNVFLLSSNVDNNIDKSNKIEKENYSGNWDSKSNCSHKEVAILSINSGLLRWSILFKYHSLVMGGWNRKRDKLWLLLFLNVINGFLLMQIH
jgi:hypothetical protein